jgi:hypothetical protein
MYFALESDTALWKNHTYYASPVNTIPEYQPHWWQCEPITPTLPTLTFAINSKMPLPDICKVAGTPIDLYSVRLINVLKAANVTFEAFPAILVDQDTGEPIHTEFKLFHLLDTYPLSKIRSRDSDGKFISLPATKLMFRPKKYFNLLIIHRDLKEEFDREGILGFSYRPFK